MKTNWLEQFRTPPHDVRPAVMWFWNDEITRGEITFQLEQFKGQGIFDIFVNLIWGTTLDYLSDEFFEMVAYAVAECRRLGLYYWIYDEFNWPSGVAGGKLLRDEPWTRAKSLVCERVDFYPGRRVDMRFDGSFEGAQIVYKDGSVEDVTGKAEIDRREEGFAIRCESRSQAPAALYIIRSRYQQAVMAACKWGKHSFDQPGYVDPFNPAAIRKFIDCTHERYKKAAGHEFGKTVKGLFTDEVCLCSPYDMGKGMLPWNDSFRGEFFRRYGYRLDGALYALFARPKTPAEHKCRYDFWRMLTELLTSAHIRQVYEWCDKNGLLYTGHFDGEESLAWDMFQSGDIFDLMPWMHIPGIDSIFSRDRVDFENFNTAGKLVSSAARFFGRDRTLCETYTGSSWKLRLCEMRRIANRLTVLGVNMIQYMGAYYSLDGARKRLPLTYPPSHGYNNPLFSLYGALGDYIGRIQYISSVSRPAGKTLVLLPLAGVYSDADVFDSPFRASKDEYSTARYEQAYFGTVNALLDSNIEFDLAGDSMAKLISAENGEALLYTARYDCVTIPLASKTTAAVASLIDRLCENGVKTVFVDETPSLLADTARTVDTASALGFPAALEGLFEGKTPNLCLVRAENKKRAADKYRELLAAAVGAEHRLLDAKHGGGVYVSHRKMDGSDVYFIANDASEPREFRGKLPKGRIAALLDPETGKAYQITSPFALDLAPCRLLIIVCDEITAASLPACKAPPAAKAFKTATLAPKAFEAEGGNLLPAEYSAAKGDLLPSVSAAALPQSFVKCKNGEIPGGLAALGDEVTAVWDFCAQDVSDPYAALFLETSGVERVLFNSADITGRLKKCRIWGSNNAEAQVGDLLRTGLNRLAFAFRIPGWAAPHHLPAAVLRGRFCVLGGGLAPLPDSLEIAPLEKTGFPCFGGTFSYEFSFDAPERPFRAVLSLKTLDAADVEVNGLPAGRLMWAPFELDVTACVKPGANTVKISLKIPYANLMGDALSCGLEAPPAISFYPPRVF